MNYIKTLLKNNKYFILVVLLAFIFRSVFLDMYQVPSGSMEPTIAIGDRLLTNKMAYDLRIPFTKIMLARFSDPQRGQIVVFKQKDNVRMVKRVIGIPGDHLTVEDGWVTINGHSLDAEQVSEKNNELLFLIKDRDYLYLTKFTGTLRPFPPLDFTIPEGKYFVMGDNRDQSADSRAWGFVDRTEFDGRAMRVAFNFQFKSFPPVKRIGKSFKPDLIQLKNSEITEYF